MFKVSLNLGAKENSRATTPKPPERPLNLDHNRSILSNKSGNILNQSRVSAFSNTSNPNIKDLVKDALSRSPGSPKIDEVKEQASISYI